MSPLTVDDAHRTTLSASMLPSKAAAQCHLFCMEITLHPALCTDGDMPLCFDIAAHCCFDGDISRGSKGSHDSDRGTDDGGFRQLLSPSLREVSVNWNFTHIAKGKPLAFNVSIVKRSRGMLAFAFHRF